MAGGFKLLPLHMTMVWTMLLELESWHRAKAVVCASKQRAPSEDRDGDSSSTPGPRPPSR